MTTHDYQLGYKQKLAQLKKQTQKQEIAQLKNQLDKVLQAYNILEEYCSEIVCDLNDNETITYANSIVKNALNIEIK
jgi:hypothetical protein